MESGHLLHADLTCDSDIIYSSDAEEPNVQKNIGCGWMQDAMYKKYKMDQRKAGKEISNKQKKKKKKCK